MTFNRYICFRAILESIGAIACMLMALIGNNLLGVIVAAIAALLWIGGEVWGMTVFRRQNPRRDELSDMHQSAAMQFALVSLVGILVIVGFIYTTLNLIDRSIVSDVYLEVQHPCWSCNSNSSSANASAARIQFVSATLVFGLAAFDCSLAISSSHTSLGVLYPRSFMGVSLISPTIASRSSWAKSSNPVPLGR